MTVKMTDSSKKQRHHAVTVFYASIALFAVVLALLVIRLEAGLDPAIGKVRGQTAKPHTAVKSDSAAQQTDPIPAPETRAS